MSGGMADELWPLEEAVGEFLKRWQEWDRVDDNGSIVLAIPVVEIAKLREVYEEVQEALDEIEEREDGDDEEE